MKLRAFFSAVALIVLIAPVNAHDVAAPGDGATAGRAEPSHQSAIRDVEVPLITASTSDGQDADSSSADAAADQISATLQAKIRAIIALARDEPRTVSDGTELLRSRIHVHCSVREVVSKREPSLPAAPALMLSERAANEPARVSSTVEACTIKLLQIRRSESTEPVRRDFTLQLPPPGEAAP
jgi:hypothetical protein